MADQYEQPQEDQPVARIRVQRDRPIQVGDKLASRTGNKGIINSTWSRQFEDHIVYRGVHTQKDMICDSRVLMNCNSRH